MGTPGIMNYVIGETEEKAIEFLRGAFEFDIVRVREKNSKKSKNQNLKRLNLVLDENDLVFEAYLG